MLTYQQTYVTTYNLAQWANWSRIMYSLVQSQFSMSNNLDLSSSITHMVILSQSLCFLETLHCALNLTKGSAVTSFSQFIGRNAVLFGFVVPLQQTNVAVFYMYLAWAISEVIRYPFYAFSTLKMDFFPIVYLRYTTFIVLYPIGVMSELSVLYQAFPIATADPRYWMFGGYIKFIMLPYMIYAYGVAFPQIFRYLLKTRKQALSPTTTTINKKDK